MRLVLDLICYYYISCFFLSFWSVVNKLSVAGLPSCLLFLLVAVVCTFE